MPSGRRPIPTALKIIQGSAKKNCEAKAMPPKNKTAIRMPAWLSSDAKRQWKSVSKKLLKMGLLTELDVDALALYCESYARWREALRELKINGSVIETPNGYPVQSPYLQIANKSFDQMVKILIEFGMTPSSISKVPTSKDSENEDTLTKWGIK